MKVTVAIDKGLQDKAGKLEQAERAMHGSDEEGPELDPALVKVALPMVSDMVQLMDVQPELEPTDADNFLEHLQMVCRAIDDAVSAGRLPASVKCGDVSSYASDPAALQDVLIKLRRVARDPDLSAAFERFCKEEASEQPEEKAGGEGMMGAAPEADPMDSILNMVKGGKRR